MNILTLGIDLAKNVFALHGVDECGKPALVRPCGASGPVAGTGRQAAAVHHRHGSLFRRAPLGPAVFSLRPHRTVDGAEVRRAVPHERAPRQERRGRCRGDCEAVQRPAMRFVPVKNELSQARLAVHVARQGWVQARTACINRLRGLLSEFGIVLPLKAQTVRRQAAEHLERLPGWVRTVGADLLDELRRLDERIDAYDGHVRLIAQAEDRSQRLMQVPGIGPTTASALLAHIGHGHDFANGRQFAAWLGLVPGQ